MELNEKFSEFRLLKYLSNHLDSIELSIKNKNWQAALISSLTLPDICGYIEEPTMHSNRRYKAFFNRYVSKFYSRLDLQTEKEKIMLNGSDAYALRCAYLHSGKSLITEQRAQEVLEDFKFVSISNGRVHNNRNNNQLQLQVDVFCRDICEGVVEWAMEHKENHAMVNRAEQMMKIENLDHQNEISI